MKIFVAASIFLSATSANALQLLCHFHSFKDGALVDTLKITIGVDGGASVWHKWERTSYWDEHEKFEKVLFHSMTTSYVDGSRFSVLVTEQRFVDRDHKIDEVYPPEVYFVDWGKAKLAQVNVPFTREPLAQVDVHWECARVD